MQRYQLPSLTAVRTLADSLRVSYKESKGENPKRLSFITLLDRLTQMTALNPDEKLISAIITGAAVFELETIEAEYPHSSPVRQKGWIYNSGSRLYTDLLEKLTISDSNKLNDDERLIHLLKFFQFASRTFSDQDAQQAGYKNKQELVDKIKEKLKVIKKREFNKINSLAHSEPKLAAMRKKIDKIFPDYQVASASRMWKNSKRIESSLFVEFVNQTADKIYHQNEHYQASESDDLKNRNHIQWKNILAGVGLYALMEIYPEYKLLSASRSYHYRQCLSLFNAKNINDIDSDRKIMGLRALSAHLSDLKSMNNFDELMKTWKSKGLKDIDRMQKQVEIYIKEAQTDHPSKIREAVSYGVSTTTQFGIDYALTYGAPGLAISSLIVPTMGAIITGAALGPVGIVVYGTTGTIIATQLARLVKDKLLPQAVATIYAKILEKIGDQIGSTTAGVVVGTFTATASGIKRFMGYCKEKQKNNFLEDWINTLLELPDDIMPEKEKSDIREVLGIEPGERLTTQPEVQRNLVLR